MPAAEFEPLLRVLEWYRTYTICSQRELLLDDDDDDDDDDDKKQTARPFVRVLIC
jgi:hypothetical protein